MIILTTAVGYSPGGLAIFWDSLMETGYSGKVVVVSNDCEVLRKRGATIIPVPYKQYPISLTRHFAYKDYLKDIDEPVVLTDVRDVVFQKNPEEYMPTEGVNVFLEDASKTIGTCRFNRTWLRSMGINKWDNKNILCAGIISGRLADFTQKMCEHVKEIYYPPGGDQGVFNDLIYSGYPTIMHDNEDAEAYTVGHIPLESVKVNEDGFIVNKKGEVPCMVHMYDRHVNLTVSIIKRLNLKVVMEELYEDKISV